MEEIKIENLNSFNAEKMITMSREELISLLGPQNSERLNEGLRSGDITYSEFQNICQDSFPIPQQSKLIRDLIFNKLSKSEGFNMFESNKEKQQIYGKMTKLQEKAQNGELTKDDLRELCDNVFGKNTELSSVMQNVFIKTDRIKQNPHQNEPKKNWELEPEEKARIQNATVELAKNEFNQEQNAYDQSPVMNMNGIEM